MSLQLLHRNNVPVREVEDGPDLVVMKAICSFQQASLDKAIKIATSQVAVATAIAVPRRLVLTCDLRIKARTALQA